MAKSHQRETTKQNHNNSTDSTIKAKKSIQPGNETPQSKQKQETHPRQQPQQSTPQL
uniref:Uncharacterized protein n=1 Tax=Nelumbo nucifera TaxID=4432 RepID=A0A822XXI6_NELNU|nr:TPA_asm: hypothetical protein HUJ06_026491 [Nelumbo nucifera]